MRYKMFQIHNPDLLIVNSGSRILKHNLKPISQTLLSLKPTSMLFSRPLYGLLIREFPRGFPNIMLHKFLVSLSLPHAKQIFLKFIVLTVGDNLH